ncbi:hypothetical protein ACTA71_005153 [Dictyostelium dimigraforme]
MSSYPVDIDQHDEDQIILNVGGVKYEVMPSTLAQYPETLLGHIFHPNNRHLRKPDKKGEYFFDRNGASFDVVLNYYRTGKIVIPPNLSEEIIREELKYFKIEYKGNPGNNSNNGDNDDNSKKDPNEEDEDTKIMKLPKDQIYDYAQSFIHSSNRAEIKRGLKLLGKLREMDSNSYMYRYSYSFACYRLGENVKGIQTLQEILATDQHNPQAKSLLTLFKDVRLSNTRNGIVIGCLAVVGIYGFFKIKKWYSLAKLLNNTTIPTGVAAASNLIKTVGSNVAVGGASGNIGTSSVVGPLSSSIPHTLSSNIPEKIINHLVDSIVNNAVVEKVITNTANSSIANNTLNTITGASINSLSQSNVQSIPVDQFNRIMSNTFSK